MKLLKRLAFAVLVLAAIGLFCRGQGYLLTTDEGATVVRETIRAQYSCFRRYSEATEYDLVLRCQADADKLIRDKFKWW
jgi:hypothetical protein